MKKHQQIFSAVFLFFFGQLAQASNAFEGFIGKYEVSSIGYCAATDTWCKNLREVVITADNFGTISISEYSSPNTTPVITTLVEIPCNEAVCNISSRISGRSAEFANWSYMKAVSSTSFERHDHQSFNEDRTLNRYGNSITYEFRSTTENGATYSTIDIHRSYNLKRIKANGIETAYEEE